MTRLRLTRGQGLSIAGGPTFIRGGKRGGGKGKASDAPACRSVRIRRISAVVKLDVGGGGRGHCISGRPASARNVKGRKKKREKEGREGAAEVPGAKLRQCRANVREKGGGRRGKS